MQRNELIIKYYKEGKTYESIGRLFSLSKQRIHQIVKKYGYKHRYRLPILNYNRQPIQKFLRTQVFNRDKKTCYLCHQKFGNRKGLEIHHINRNSGDNSMRNLITLCRRCHRQLHGRLNKIHYF